LWRRFWQASTSGGRSVVVAGTNEEGTALDQSQAVAKFAPPLYPPGCPPLSGMSKVFQKHRAALLIERYHAAAETCSMDMLDPLPEFLPLEETPM